MSPNGISIAHLGVQYVAETGQTAPSHQSIYGMTLKGEIPAKFIGGRWYVAEADIPVAIDAIKRRYASQAA